MGVNGKLLKIILFNVKWFSKKNRMEDWKIGKETKKAKVC
jgi:hypothetical protein